MGLTQYLQRLLAQVAVVGLMVVIQVPRVLLVVQVVAVVVEQPQ